MEFIDLKTPFLKMKPEIMARIEKVLDHGQYIMGPEIKQLENDNKEVLNNRKKLTTARISNRRKLYKYDSKLYLQKNEIEDLPIVPIYVKKKVKK